MEVLFQNEGFRQYMVMEGKFLKEQEFECNMLLHFEGKMLLPIQMQWKNGNACICYEMSGAVTVEQYFEQQEFGIRELQGLFQTYLNAYEEVETYLLTPDGLLLHPRYIFYMPGQRDFRFCYYPRESGRVLTEITELAEFCMKHTRHRDSEAVLFIYGLYHQLLEESIDVNIIQEYIQGFGIQEEEPVKVPDDKSQEKPKPPEAEEPIILASKESDSKHKQLWFYVYAGLSGIVAVFDCLFVIRFLMVTRSDADIKVSIVLTILLMIFVYSAVQANRKRIPPIKALKDEGESETVPVQEPPVELVRECAEKEEMIEGETMVLETVQKQMASVWELQEQEGAGIRIQLNRLPGVVGRKISEVDYVMNGDGVSRRHALLFLSGEELYVQDLGSTNGTYVNGVRLIGEEPMRLRETDVLMIGGKRYLINRNKPFM